MMSRFKEFQQDSGCSEIEIAQFVEEIEADLVNTELKVSGVDYLSNILTVRRKFYSLVNDESISNEAVASYANENSDSLTKKLHANSIATVREVLATGKVLFTSCEPPSNVVLLCTALHLLKDNAPEGDIKPHLILATTTRYFPHASVRLVKGNIYFVFLSARLVWDLYFVSAIFTELIVDSQDDGEMSFVKPFITGKIRDVYHQSIHSIQLPYQLAALALGENFRFALNLMPSTLMEPWGPMFHSFYYCMLAFLIGHEIGHIVLGHCSPMQNAERDRDIGLFDDLVLNPLSPIYSLQQIAPLKLEYYRRNYAWQHSRELDADQLGVAAAANVAVDLFNDRNVGFIAASIVLGLVSWLDRASFCMQKLVDPVKKVGEQNWNSKIAYIDVTLPRPTHPWGRTRHAALCPYIKFASGANFTDKEWLALLDGIRNAHYPFSCASSGAFSSLTFVIMTGHEVVCFFTKEGLAVQLWERQTDGRCRKVKESIEDPFSFLDLEKAIKLTGI
jgi:hypothetical protein